MKYSIIIISISLISCFSAFSQDKALEKANANYENFAYVDAITDYIDIVKAGKANLEVYQKLGDSYYFNSDLNNAVKWYRKMLNQKEELPVEYYFRAAQSFKYIKDYEQFDRIMKVIQVLSSEDSRAKRWADNPDYLDDIALQSGRYFMAKLLDNSEYTDFAPSFYQDQVVFASARKDGKKNKWTEQPYLKLYSSHIETTGNLLYPMEFSKKLNSKLHESTSTFTEDGTTAYFTRNDLAKLKSGKDSIDNIIRLKIYKATLNEKIEWDNIEEISFNNPQYSVAHPALSADEKKLYFVSDMPGGYGMSDIYSVDILEDGTFGEPKNLGSKINTEGRETFPFVSKTGMLYFASDGHLGLGGLDIFVVQLDDEDQKIYNVGGPINSTADDVTFIIDDDTRKGYFASNRVGGKGDDDIYRFEEVKSLITRCYGSMQGVCLDDTSGAIIPFADIEINDENGELIYTGKTDANGIFMQDLDCDEKSYVFTVKKDKYDVLVKSIVTSKENPVVSEEFKLKKVVPKKGVDLAKILDLNPIYFASNKALILGDTAIELDKVVTYMKEYPSIRIEIGSHTDSRGSDAYNMKLSKRRATATANYVISKGIDPSRVKSRGYGETLLQNKCSNGVRCSKEQHGKNRRSEFIVIAN